MKCCKHKVHALTLIPPWQSPPFCLRSVIWPHVVQRAETAGAEGRCTMLLGMRSRWGSEREANEKGLKWRQRWIWNSGKKKKNTTPSIAPNEGELSRSGGDSLWRWLKESHSGQVTQDPGWERNSRRKSRGPSPTRHSPTSKNSGARH